MLNAQLNSIWDNTDAYMKKKIQQKGHILLKSQVMTGAMTARY